MTIEELLARRLEWGDAQSLAGEAIDFFPEEAGAAVALRVTEVSEVHSTPQMHQFRVLFHGPAAPVHAQRIYRFRHARLGDYAFFITPVRALPGAIEYEACFSHAP
jgi:hypothetical protein